MDDGSPDRCPEICDKNAATHPDKIKVVHKENGGLKSWSTSCKRRILRLYSDTLSYMETIEKLY